MRKINSSQQKLLKTQLHFYKRLPKLNQFTFTLFRKLDMKITPRKEKMTTAFIFNSYFQIHSF